MMDIMIIRVVPEEKLEGVKRKTVPAVIVDGLHCREREEEG